MKKLSMTIMTVIFFAVLTTCAFASPWGRGMGKGPACGGDMKTFSKNLDLTADQNTSISALRDAHLKDVKPLQDKMFAKRGDLRLLWLEKNPNQKKIVDLQKEIRTLRGQMQDKATEFRFAAAKVLTPEQKAKLQSSFKGRGHGHGAGFGAMGCPGDPCGSGIKDGPGRRMRGNR